tara:strand:- start:424 stop:2064 length:1641 start_codon:yes stop_codon:yes gene_type:complete
MKVNPFLDSKKNILEFFKKHQFDKVVKFGKKLIKKNSDFQLFYVLGISYFSLKNYREAEKTFRNVISIQPSPENYFIYGNIHKQLQNFNEAAEAFEKAIDLKSNYSDAYNNLGNVKRKLGFTKEAIKNYQKAIDTRKNNLQAYFNLAHLYNEEKNFDDLKQVLQNVLNFDKNNTTALNDLGYLNLIFGKIDEGRKFFEKVLNIDDKHIRAFKNYFLITKVDNHNKYFKKLENLDLSNISDEDKIFAYTSLSKCNFDLNNSELALKYLGMSNKIKKINSNFSLEVEQKLFKKLKILSKETYCKIADQDDNIKFTPVFIVGMPRSGTTLLEQVLSSHSNIHGAGELNYLPKIIDKFNLYNIHNFDNFIKTIRLEYHDRVSKLSKKKFIIDKLPMNFRWIGFITKAFPEAKIIHIQRNPMAICWSNYKINFPDPGMDFSLSQSDTAKYYILYDDLMNFWTENLKNKIIQIKYENFVNNFENETQSLIEKLGLRWEESLLKYDKNYRPVQTASLLQVREKIIKNSSDQWKKYEKYLLIMQKILKSNKITF